MDRAAERSAELEPTLALLAQVEAEASSLRRSASRQAAQRQHEAFRQAEEIVEQARVHARSLRMDSATRVRQAAEAEAEEFRASASHQAEALRRRTQERLPTTIDQVCAVVADQLNIREPARPRPQADGGPEEGSR